MKLPKRGEAWQGRSTPARCPHGGNEAAKARLRGAIALSAASSQHAQLALVPTLELGQTRILPVMAPLEPQHSVAAAAVALPCHSVETATDGRGEQEVSANSACNFLYFSDRFREADLHSQSAAAGRSASLKRQSQFGHDRSVATGRFPVGYGTPS